MAAGLHRPRDVVLFVVILSTVLALGAGLAHAYELPNKIGLARDAYFTVQQIYRGWAQLGYVLDVQLLSIAAVVALSRHERPVMRLALAALACLVAAQAVFWVYAYPANVATRDWTSIPSDWQALRAQWEYSHLAGAAFRLLCVGLLAAATLARGRALSEPSR